MSGGVSFLNRFPAAKERAQSSAFFGSEAIIFILGLILCKYSNNNRAHVLKQNTVLTLAATHIPATNPPPLTEPTMTSKSGTYNLYTAVNQSKPASGIPYL